MSRPVMQTLSALLALALAISAYAQPLAASAPLPGQHEGDVVVADFHLRDGQVLPELRLHYLTLGQPHRDQSGRIDNAVLLLHSTGDDSTLFLLPYFASQLFGPRQPLDLAHFFVIAPDALGHGKSSKPSDGLRGRFPHYGYEDIVAAQHELVTRLGVTHLRLVLGVSMGGMHTWLWGERYPDMMDALLPIGALPVEIGGRNRLWRHMIVEAIRNDPAWKNGDYDQQPRVFSRLVPLIVMMTGNPARQYEAYPTRAAADAWYDELQARSARADTNDRLYQYEASSDYDPAPDLEKIKANLVQIEFADDQINAPEFPVLDKQMPRVKHGRYVIIPASDTTRGESHDIIDATLWRSELERLLRETDRDASRR